MSSELYLDSNEKGLIAQRVLAKCDEYRAHPAGANNITSVMLLGAMNGEPHELPLRALDQLISYLHCARTLILDGVRITIDGTETKHEYAQFARLEMTGNVLLGSSGKDSEVEDRLRSLCPCARPKTIVRLQY